MSFDGTRGNRFLPLFRRRFVRFCVENGPKRPKSHFAGLPRPMIRYSHVTPLCGSCSARAVDTFCTIRRSPSPAGRGDPMAAKKQKFFGVGPKKGGFRGIPWEGGSGTPFWAIQNDFHLRRLIRSGRQRVIWNRLSSPFEFTYMARSAESAHELVFGNEDPSK